MDIDIYGHKWPFFSTSVSAFRIMKKMNLRLLSIFVMVLCGVDGLLQGKVIQSSSLHNSPVEDQPEVGTTEAYFYIGLGLCSFSSWHQIIMTIVSIYYK